MDKYCRGCAYRQTIMTGHTNCGYAVITGNLRGCPPGAGCTRKAKTKSKVYDPRIKWETFSLNG